MIQIELYVDGVEVAETLFTTVFGLTVFENHAGWRQLRHGAEFDIMLFDPGRNTDGDSHWPIPAPGKGGAGIELVLGSADVAQTRRQVQELGYACSDLTVKPWGSTEFTFQLREGYLLRIKQPPVKAGG